MILFLCFMLIMAALFKFHYRNKMLFLIFATLLVLITYLNEPSYRVNFYLIIFLILIFLTSFGLLSINIVIRIAFNKLRYRENIRKIYLTFFFIGLSVLSYKFLVDGILEK
ncbi:hypothetical protein SAMN05660772_02346 [Pasteurella testudinis DSM 23072]|uniref:Uncharacterized protein n=1 Tax=Pasteurella testudinis DSM 23072 TaxID=1122938 RepID=A0A1W1UVR8_9PAST|nr:hypothetical protein SAMN05660772_02346 [Pasteurella testudinis DSM 23072]SUB51267.1 Uncharacterised protein [Pasteurella testudinis]